MNEPAQEQYTGYIGVAGEGRRFGLVSCLRCGASVTVGFEKEDSVGLHDAWHDFLTANLELPDLGAS